MVKLSLLCVFVFSLISMDSAQAPQVDIIPRPNSIEPGTGSFHLSAKTVIVAPTADDRRTADLFNGYLRSQAGMALKVASKAKSDAITFSVFRGIKPLEKGGYELTVKPDGILIATSDPAGALYAAQSLLQLIPVGTSSGAEIPAVTIRDAPRFGYRGMHLDVTRHFFPAEFVKKYIDLMAQYKFNYFHWHLTDDQGWRIEIKKYPKLTEIGSTRPETVVGRNLQPYVGDKTPHGGFYTQEQIKDVVAYAKARQITIIPEIETPGHSSAALAAYPEFGCKADYKYKVQTTWGIFKEVYCPTEKTFKFLEDVLGEVIDLFPDSPYIHVGGDEVLKDMWKDSPEVQELMKRENLKDVNEVQSYFIRRIEKYVNSRGKRVIGWDEILEGGLAPNATVMSWRGIKGGIEAAKSHHDVIMTPSDSVYFDYGQGDPSTEPLNIGNYVPLSKVYSFDPVPKELAPDEAKYIIGGQANVWTEYIPTTTQVEYMAFPRMLALAEDLWTQPENKNYDDFYRRLMAQLPRLDKENVAYRIPEPAGLDNQVLAGGQPAVYQISSSVPSAKVVYTIDGTDPSETSQVLPTRLSLDPSANGVLTLKTVTILPNGRKSAVYSSTAVWHPWLTPSPEPKDKRAGLTFAFSAPVTSGVPNITSGEARAIGFQGFARGNDLKQPFEVSFDGLVNVAADGLYEFQAESNWDAAIVIDGEKVVGHAGSKDRSVTSGVVPLRAGYHKISVRYGSHGGDALLRVRWGLKGQGLRVLGGGDLAH